MFTDILGRKINGGVDVQLLLPFYEHEFNGEVGKTKFRTGKLNGEIINIIDLIFESETLSDCPAECLLLVENEDFDKSVGKKLIIKYETELLNWHLDKNKTRPEKFKIFFSQHYQR